MTTRIALAFALFVAPLFAQAIVAQEKSLIHLKGGRFYHVVVLNSTWEYVEVRYTPAEGKAMTIKVKQAEFDPFSFYGLRNKAIGKIFVRFVT